MESDHVRFKVLLVGDASVGKSSLIKEFIEKHFDGNYKITVGLDLLVKDVYISDEDLPEEAFEIIKDAIAVEKKRIKEIRKLEKISKVMAEETGNPEIITEEIRDDPQIMNLYKKRKKKKKFYLFLVIASIFLIIAILAILIS
ncbi:MAG: hypothetical protein ACFFHV_13620 [Promethearchaeota archaeon]